MLQNIKKFIREIIKEFKISFFKLKKLELFYWIIIALFIILLGIILKITLLSSVISVLVILGGVIMLDKDRTAVVLTVAMLFLVIWTSSLQYRSLNNQIVSLQKQIDSLELEKKSYETAYRPYLGIEIIETVFFEDGIDTEIFIKNTGAVPANNYRVDYTCESQGLKLGIKNIEEPEPMIIFPNSIMGSTVEIEGTPEAVKDIFNGKRNLILNFIITYDGVRTKGHKTECSLWYDYKTKNFSLKKGFAN